MQYKKVFTFALECALSISMLAGLCSSSNEAQQASLSEDTSFDRCTNGRSLYFGDLTQTAPKG